MRYLGVYSYRWQGLSLGKIRSQGLNEAKMSTGILTEAELKQAEKMVDDDKSKRAMYFTTQLARHCFELTEQLIADFREVKPESNGGSMSMTEEEYRAVIKELLSLSILMTLLQQAREANRTPWLDNFFDRAFATADHVYPEPSCEAVIERYAPEAELSDTCLAIAMSLGYRLHLPSDNEVTMGIGQRLFEAQHDRSTILRDALKAPAADLERLVREPLPMVIV